MASSTVRFQNIFYIVPCILFDNGKSVRSSRPVNFAKKVFFFSGATFLWYL